jgi:diamine N-acetyltransferase
MEYSIIDLKEIIIIKELWGKLNLHHLERSPDFNEHYTHQTFESRFAKIMKMPGGCVRVEAAYDDSGKPVGYCVCSMENGAGELDSIYIKPPFRKKGVGFILARNGIEWMKEKGCDPIIVTVAGGNEDVFPFYEELGFRVRKTVLQLK